MSLVENLRRDYKDFLVDIPKWEINDQGVTVLWGPSGSGKTSVLRLLMGLEPCPTLRWNFSGVDLAQQDVPKRKLGVVFQNYELFPHMTARQNIEFAAEARGRSLPETESEIQNLCGKLLITSIQERKAEVLSGGERQRVALARALIGQPRALLLDEPFSNLDEDHRHEARSVVQSVIRNLKIPVILVTHDREDIRALADYVVEIKNGQISQTKKAGEFHLP